MKETNLFKHAPKELVTDAFLTWLFYFLDSMDEFSEQKQILFNELLLQPKDKDKLVDEVSVIKQAKGRHGRSDVILNFHLNHEKKSILFENKTWTGTTREQLNGYKEDNPGFYKYIYLKLGYINYGELLLTQSCGYEIIDVNQLSEALSKIQSVSSYIADYNQFITGTFKDVISRFPEELYKKNNQNLLWDGQAQQFVFSDLYRKIDGQFKYIRFKTGSSSGRPWTEIDFCKKERIFGEEAEFIFWRIDIRSGNFYIRLNQWADIGKDMKMDKIHRRDRLRKIAEEISNNYDVLPGRLNNKGLKESEIIIFFLNENRIENLINILPDFSKDFYKLYKNT